MTPPETPARLLALVASWREEAVFADRARASHDHIEWDAGKAIRDCADELEALLRDAALPQPLKAPTVANGHLAACHWADDLKSHVCADGCEIKRTLDGVPQLPVDNKKLPERTYLECPCCGDDGAVSDADAQFHDGQMLICGCPGWVSLDADGGDPWINNGEEPCQKCHTLS